MRRMCLWSLVVPSDEDLMVRQHWVNPDEWYQEKKLSWFSVCSIGISRSINVEMANIFKGNQFRRL